LPGLTADGPAAAKPRAPRGSPGQAADGRAGAEAPRHTGTEPPAASGLRERKKARTKAAIQHHALRLFREQGYYATTVEQIAEAAEVSPSTFFRYFPTKEDVVLRDDYDPVLVAAFKAQPAELGPIEAMRGAVRSAFTAIPPEEVEEIRERSELMLEIPELQAASLVNLTQTMRMLTGVVAERVGRKPDDFAVRNFAGALLGVWISVLFEWAAHPEVELVTALDDAMAHLEAGLPL
jgi:AcrR family transcriptional regulator